MSGRAATIGVMARAPRPGRCKTRLAQAIGDVRAAELYAAMLDDTLDGLAKVGAGRLVVMAAPEENGAEALRAIVPPGWEVAAQEGADLGDRLAHAFATLGAGGIPVLLVASDSPTMPFGPLRDALLDFGEPGTALMGPCRDGGYYLIGLPAPEPGILRDVPWSTAAVAETTRARCRELGIRLRELPSAFDVDEPRDLEILRTELASSDPERAPRTRRALARIP